MTMNRLLQHRLYFCTPWRLWSCLIPLVLLFLALKFLRQSISLTALSIFEPSPQIGESQPLPTIKPTYRTPSELSQTRPPGNISEKKIGDGHEPFADNEELRMAYKRSPCSGLENVFVGSDPLFPPCRSTIPRGVAYWGKYPYLGPFNYTKLSKNPCFYNKQGQLRCVPYFFLPGFSKCGSSDLHSRIAGHPQVVVTKKEHMWFSRKRFPEYEHYKLEGIDQYMDGFNALAKAAEKQIKNTGYSNLVTGDSSIEAINEVFEWPQLSGNEFCPEPRVIHAHHIRHLNPDIKILIIMRHPVQRLYSRFLFDYNRPYLMEFRKLVKISPKLRTPQVFHDYVVEGLELYQECFRRSSLRECIYNRTLYEAVRGLKIQDTMYAMLLEDWLRVIPRDQILFLRSEDVKKDMKRNLETVFKFLELDPVSDKQMDRILKKNFLNVNKKPVGPMLPETERLLQEFFKPFIHRVAQLLNDPRFLWEDV